MRLFEAIQTCAEAEGFRRTKQTNQGYNRDRLNFAVFLQNPHIEEIGEEDIVRFFKLLKESGLDQNSLQIKSIAIRGLFSYWLKRGKKVLNPDFIPIPSREFKMPRVAEHWQYQAFLRGIPKITNDKRHPRMQAMVRLLYDTGARGTEIAMLNTKDLDFSDPVQGRAIIRTEKSRGRKPIREILWTPETTKYLKEWLEVRTRLARTVTFKDPDAVFVGVRCWQTGKRMTISAMDIAFRKHCQAIGLEPRLRPHMLRHLKGHDLNESGANNSTISNILGHASIASSFIYTMMNDKELKKAALKYNRNRKN